MSIAKYCVILLGASALVLACQAQTNAVLVSTKPFGGASPGAALDAVPAAVTPDGRWVLFSSSAHNIVAQQESWLPLNFPVPDVVNVYLRDGLSNITHLVSAGMGHSAASAHCLPVAISTNGRMVLFESAATNIVPGVRTPFEQLYLRDVMAQTNMLVSAGPGGQVGNGISRYGAITPDGLYAVFTSAATNLVANDTNGIADVFRRNLLTGEMTLVSEGARRTSSNPWPFTSERPLITPSGRYVAFLSTAVDQVPMPESGAQRHWDVFLRDVEIGSTMWVSQEGAAQGSTFFGSTNIHCFNHVISDDGQYVSYMAAPVGGRIGLVLRYDTLSQATEVISTNAMVAPGAPQDIADLAATPNNQILAFPAAIEGVTSPSNNVSSILVYNASTRSNVLASVDATGEAMLGLFKQPAISGSGTRIAFASNVPRNVTNWTGGITNASGGAMNLYLRDLQAGSNHWVNATSEGARVDIGGAWPILAADGNVVIFAGRAPGDLAYQVYARDLRSGELELISARSELLPDISGGLSSFIDQQSVVSDGKRLVYTSYAPDLAFGDTNAASDIFLYDFESHTNVLVSTGTNNLPGNGFSLQPWLSENGRYVAYASASSDMAAGDTNMAADVFMRDLQAGDTWLVSTQINNGLPGQNASFSPQLSADGTRMIFQTFSRGMGSNSSYNPNPLVSVDLIYCDLTNGSRVSLSGLVSMGAMTMSRNGSAVAYLQTSPRYFVFHNIAAGTRTNVAAYQNLFNVCGLALSPSGRFLLYAYGVVTRAVHIYDTLNGTDEVIANMRVPKMARFPFSADDSLVGYCAMPNHTALITNVVYVYSLIGKTNVFVSNEAPNLVPFANDDAPDISPDGRFIAWRRAAAASNSFTSVLTGSIMVHDRTSGLTTTLASGPGRPVGPPRFSTDGRFLVFSSALNNQTAMDFNGAPDVYAIQMPGGGSIPVFTAALRRSPEGWLLKWPIMQGRIYRVEYKNRLEDAQWVRMDGNVLMDGSEGRVLDAASNEQRFYRVVAQ